MRILEKWEKGDLMQKRLFLIIFAVLISSISMVSVCSVCNGQVTYGTVYYPAPPLTYPLIPPLIPYSGDLLCSYFTPVISLDPVFGTVVVLIDIYAIMYDYWLRNFAQYNWANPDDPILFGISMFGAFGEIYLPTWAKDDWPTWIDIFYGITPNPLLESPTYGQLIPILPDVYGDWYVEPNWPLFLIF